MATHFPILLLAIFLAIATHQIQGRPFKPQMPLHSSPSVVGFGQSNTGSKDDFRPTMPGNSPGVGHHSVKKSGSGGGGGGAQSENNMEGVKDDDSRTAGSRHAIHRIASKPNA